VAITKKSQSEVPGGAGSFGQGGRVKGCPQRTTACDVLESSRGLWPGTLGGLHCSVGGSVRFIDYRRMPPGLWLVTEGYCRFARGLLAAMPTGLLYSTGLQGTEHHLDATRGCLPFSFSGVSVRHSGYLLTSTNNATLRSSSRRRGAQNCAHGSLRRQCTRR
jgi:hypothetical protein